MKNNNKVHSGFTLSEMIIALVIIGIVSMFLIPVLIRQQNDYDEGIYYMYKALTNFGRIINTTSCSGKIDSFICDDNIKHSCDAVGQTSCSSENLTDLSNDETFCNLMTETFRVAKQDCSTFTNATIGNSPETFNDNIYGNINADTEPNMVLLNGYQVFISSLATYMFSHAIPDSSPYNDDYEYTQDINYRIITFDLNGYKNPNENGTDRISYLLWNDGTVILLGEPAVNTNLAKGAIRRFLRKKCEDCDNMAEFKKNEPVIRLDSEGKKRFMSFSEAYCKANFYREPDFTGVTSSNGVMFGTPLIYGDKFFYPDYCGNTTASDDCTPGSDYICDFYFPRPSKGIIDKLRSKEYSNEYNEDGTRDFMMNE